MQRAARASLRATDPQQQQRAVVLLRALGAGEVEQAIEELR